jgi:magnesium chelatase accessory protein
MNTMNRVPYDWPNRQISRSVEVAGLAWHVQISGKGPLILLLHGTGSSTHSWAELTPILNKEAQILNLDLPGHAFTLGALIDSLKLEEIARSLIGLVQELKLPWPTMVVGHSAGAPLALAFAVQAKVKPQIIIGFNPSLIPPPPSYTQFFGPMLGPVTKSATLASILAKIAPMSGMTDRLLDSTNTNLPETNRNYYRRLFTSPDHVRGAMNFMASANISQVLSASSNLPSKLIWVIGESDQWVPEIGLQKIIQQYFAKSTVIHWQGGHIMHEVETEKSADLILSELRTLKK